VTSVWALWSLIRMWAIEIDMYARDVGGQNMYKAQIVIEIKLAKAPDQEQMIGLKSAINFEVAKVLQAYEAIEGRGS